MPERSTGSRTEPDNRDEGGIPRGETSPGESSFPIRVMVSGDPGRDRAAGGTLAGPSFWYERSPTGMHHDHGSFPKGGEMLPPLNAGAKGGERASTCPCSSGNPLLHQPVAYGGTARGADPRVRSPAPLRNSPLNIVSRSSRTPETEITGGWLAGKRISGDKGPERSHLRFILIPCTILLRTSPPHLFIGIGTNSDPWR